VRDRTAVALRLSSIPISLASTPFNDNSRRRSSSAAVQSFMDDLLSPFGRIIGLAPQSEPSMRRGSAPVFYFADVTYFFPGRPRSKNGTIQARPKLLEQSRWPLALEFLFRFGRDVEAECVPISERRFYAVSESSFLRGFRNR
jgi:hypothetical protein